ncbi:glycosyltransferase family 4 protein [Arcticibacter sp. MXS-1]|uniref:glycosyltransferase family 4 protein n=1 Tax=Arcticibacter sp. MXS-1 TaxID=3341726 RepID=UPI0035A887B7
MTKVLLSHPTGNANVRAVAEGLYDEGLLGLFQTSLASFPNDLLYRLGGLGPLSEIKRRSFDPKLQLVTRAAPWREVGRLLASKLRIPALVAHEEGPFCVDAVYRSIDKVASNALAAKKYQAIYAYEDGALQSFKMAKKLGVQCLYDLPIGYWRAAKELLENEQDRWPEWASTLVTNRDSIKKLSRKDEELQLADRIFVASQFTAKTLSRFPGSLAKVEVIPYGFPPAAASRVYDEKIHLRKLRLIFVGGLSQRKGIADLFAAVDRLGDYVSLTVVGRKTAFDCKALDSALSKHTWLPSLSHPEVLQKMREHDVLVFPSLFEGFGLVITEAMSQGTPVITTDRTVGPDIISDGENGWLIEAGSSSGIFDKITSILQEPEKVAKAGAAAMETARTRPWSVYRKELAKAVKRHLT